MAPFRGQHHFDRIVKRQVVKPGEESQVVFRPVVEDVCHGGGPFASENQQDEGEKAQRIYDA